MMTFPQPLIHGFLLQRYKRFLADVRLDDGSVVTAHCTNSGTMQSALEEGAEVYLSPASNPARKTRFTWEMIKIGGSWVGINTNVPNILVYEAVRDQQIEGLQGYTTVRQEVRYEDSRLDVYAKNDQEQMFIEVKNVTLKEGDYALFPDARTKRGARHLQTLIRIRHAGMRAVMVYVVQRSDVTRFGPAAHIDPDYAHGLKEAVNAGVEVFALRARVSPEEIRISGKLPFHAEL